MHQILMIHLNIKLKTRRFKKKNFASLLMCADKFPLKEIFAYFHRSVPIGATILHTIVQIKPNINNIFEWFINGIYYNVQ